MSFWRRLRAWFSWRAPRTLRFTRTGTTYFVVTLGVGLGALNTGNNLLYLVLGFMLSLIVASGVLSERCLRGLRVKRLLPEAAFAGEPFALRYQLWRTLGRSFAVHVRELDGKLKGAAFSPLVETRDPVTVRATCVADRRGPMKLEAVELSTAYPFGLFVKTRRVEIEEELLVFPRRGFVCADPDPGGANQLGDRGNPRRKDGSGDLWGLRELQPGEDARRVHWVKSAQVGRLLRAERESEERAQFRLEVDDRLAGDPLERKCEETAAMAHRLLGQGHEVGLTAGEHRVRPGGGAAQEMRLLRVLAWVGFEGSANVSSRRSGLPSSAPSGPPSPSGRRITPARTSTSTMNARARRRLRLVLRDLAALSAFAAVGLSGGLPIWASAVFVVALLSSLLGFRPLSGRGVTAAVLLLCIAIGLGFLVSRGGMDLVIAACTFATLVLAHRMLSEPMARTDHQVHLTSLLLLVGGAALTGELWFGACLTGFTVLASLSLGLLTLEGPEADQLPIAVRPLLGSLGSTVAVCMLGGVAFFALFPRLSWNIAARRATPGLGGTTGMSDRVRLGAGGNIKTSARVVLRASLTPDPGVDQLDSYWPGRSFDTFDGREWAGTGVARAPRGRVDLGTDRPNRVHQNIELLPGYDSRTLVALDRPVTFANAVMSSTSGSARATLVQVVDEEVHVNEAANAYTYQAYSMPPGGKQDVTELRDVERYTALPAIDPRVAPLAKQLAAGEADPVRAGRKLETWLKGNFGYSLELGAETPDPLATFLFDRKEGHCEHFATALAVMLRSLGFAARVTAGFYGGERIGEQYVVRAGDAHAWVQVFEPGQGWVLLDATPPSGRGSSANAVLEWLTNTYERLQALWRRAVVDYSFQDQLQIAQSLVRPPRSASHSSLEGPPKQAWIAAAVVALTVYAAWRLTRGGTRKKKHAATGFLGRIEDRLRATGIAVQSEEPLEELVARLESAHHPAAPAVRAASQAYLASRFGGRPLTPEAKAALLAAITARPRQQPRA